MALIKCPDCGIDVSDAAPACPKCGKPIAPLATSREGPGATVMDPTSKKTTTVTITISSFVLVVLALCAAVWFVPPLQVGKNVETSCRVNGFGEGSCQFTNTGWTPGSECVVVKLTNRRGGSAKSEPVCSGSVWPNDTAQKDVAISIGDVCDDTDGAPDLKDACSMDIVGTDTSDTSAGPSATSAVSETRASASSPASSMSAATRPASSSSAARTSTVLSIGSVVPGPFDAKVVVQLLPTLPDDNGNPVKAALVFASDPFQGDGATKRFVLVSYANSGDCHACGLSIGGAVLAQAPNGWELKSWANGVTTLGGFGQLGGEAKAIALGADHPAAFVRTHYMGQGEEDQHGTLFAVVSRKVSVVWDAALGTDDSGTLQCENDKSKCSKWSADLNILDTMTDGWADIGLTAKGTSLQDDGSIVDVNRADTLRFNGSMYVAQQNLSSAAPVEPAPTASASTPDVAMPSVPASPSSIPSALQEVTAKTDGPSFDCSTATNPTAVAICSNTGLSQLDRQMATLYYSRTNYVNDPNARAQQRAWIHERNSSCGADVICLRQEFNARIQQLQQTGAPPAGQ